MSPTGADGEAGLASAAPQEGASTAGAEAFRKNVRGSSLLLSGRVLSIGAKFLIQVLVVRYLSTADFGAWVYALAVVAFLGSFASLSFNRSISYFAAVYHQRREYGEFLGAILVTVGTIVLVSALFAAGVHLFPEQLTRLAGGDPEPVRLLSVLVFLVPLEALDTLLLAIFATFDQPRAIFFRKYVLGMAIQLGVVILLIALGAGVDFLAWGYVAGGAVGVAINAALLLRLLRREGLLERDHLRRVRLPAREMFSFSLPLVTEDLLTALVHSSSVLLLGYFHGTLQVAAFRVVQPLADQNKLVIQTFATLFVPAASRLFARGEREGIHDLYWRTAVWVALLTFPIFALTFGAATPLTVLFYGWRYESSGVLLAVLALGGFAEASIGFNRQTLRVLGKSRTIVAVNLAAAAANLTLALLLIPAFGALGAAAAVAGTYVINNLLRQIALRRVAGFSLIDPRYARIYAVIGAATVGLAALLVLRPHGALALGAAAAIALLVLFAARKSLGVQEVFPELARIRLLRGVLT